MGFGFSVRRLVTEILEFQKKKLVENRKITFFFQATLKLNSENFYCHRASSFDVSHRFIGEEDQTKIFRPPYCSVLPISFELGCVWFGTEEPKSKREK